MRRGSKSLRVSDFSRWPGDKLILGVRLDLAVWLLVSVLAASLPTLASSAERPLEFRAWVQVHYRWKANLEGWASTAKSLSAIIPGASHLTMPEISVDQGTKELERLLAMPTKREGSFKVLYLGLHVNRKGEMLFSDGKSAAPGSIADRVSSIPDRWEPDVVVVDTCHAAAFVYDHAWVDAFPCPHLFAADTHQLAWERNLNTRQPIDLGKLYPDVRSRLAEILGPSWNGAISDLGFRAAKLAAAGGSPDGAASFLKGIAAVPPEEFKSTRFRNSDLLWVTPDRLLELSR